MPAHTPPAVLLGFLVATTWFVTYVQGCECGCMADVGFNVPGCAPSPPPPPPPELGWELGTPGVSCTSYCSGVGKSCIASRFTNLGTVSTCSKTTNLMTALGVTYSECVVCDPSDSTNTYCFAPGFLTSSKRVYTQTSGTYTCDMVSRIETTPICPCG